MISANDTGRILAKLINACHDPEDALAQHPVHVGKQIKCSRCGSLVPIFEGVTTVVRRPAYVARPRNSRLAQKNKMQAQLLPNLLHGATLPTSRLWSAEGFRFR
jgi:hypothetical protein